MMNMIGAADTYFPTTFRMKQLSTVLRAASIVWAAVAVLLLVLTAAAYTAGMRAARRAEPFRDRIWLSGEVSSPAVYGIFRPRILIPSDLKEMDLTYVLRHEQAHIRRLDNLWRLVALATAAVHWFNPFVWLFLKCFLEDLELACDETVLSGCSQEERRQYASALVDQYESRSLFASAFGGASLRSRVMNILTYRKLSVLSWVFLLLFAGALALALLTNPV